jgi:hypothetical protein
MPFLWLLRLLVVRGKQNLIGMDLELFRQVLVLLSQDTGCPVAHVGRLVIQNIRSHVS